VLCLVGALLAVAVFYGLCRLEGNTLSFTDTLSATAQFGWPLARSALAGLFVGSIPLLIGLLSEEQPSPLPDGRDYRLARGLRDYRWPNAVAVGYDYVLCVCYVWLLPVLVAYWQHGAWITWYLPDPATLVLHGFLLQQLVLVALLSPGVAWLIGALRWAVERRRTLASRHAAPWDPIAYLRR
jgi:hypothetical protein